jgi:hypothetical protein
MVPLCNMSTTASHRDQRLDVEAGQVPVLEAVRERLRPARPMPISLALLSPRCVAADEHGQMRRRSTGGRWAKERRGEDVAVPDIQSGIRITSIVAGVRMGFERQISPGMRRRCQPFVAPMV